MKNGKIKTQEQHKEGRINWMKRGFFLKGNTAAILARETVAITNARTRTRTHTFSHHGGVNGIWSSVLQTDEGLNDVSWWLLPESSSLNGDLKSFHDISISNWNSNPNLKWHQTCPFVWLFVSVSGSIKLTSINKQLWFLHDNSKVLTPTWPPFLI